SASASPVPRWRRPTPRSAPPSTWPMPERARACAAGACRKRSAAPSATPAIPQISHPGTLVGYVHNLGHGVGFDLHEFPTFKKASGAEGVLREGDVFTLEPGLYSVEERYGVRLEDLV